jgi:hypothetical protein
MQNDLAAPRPTRPRSWWSWARPKRSRVLDQHPPTRWARRSRPRSPSSQPAGRARGP